MTHEIELTLPVPYSESVLTSPTNIIDRTAFVTVKMTVPVLDPRKARTLAVARLRSPDEIRWIDCGSGPMRPLLKPDAEPDDLGIGFKRPDRYWWDHGKASRATEDWPDYPFPGWFKNNDRCSNARGTIFQSDLGEMVVQARKIANQLVFHEGDIYRPASLPVWTVEDLREVVPGMARLSLILPDLERPDVGGRQPRVKPGLGLFALHDKEAALRASRELFGDPASAHGRRRKIPDTHLTASDFSSIRKPHSQLVAEAAGTLRICRDIDDAVDWTNIWEIGGNEFVEAFQDFQVAENILSKIINRRLNGDLKSALNSLYIATRIAAELLSREVRPDPELVFLFRAATAIQATRMLELTPMLNAVVENEVAGPRM